MSTVSAEELSSLIQQYFGFLVDEYGFQLNKNSDSNHDFVSSTTKISIFTEYNNLVVSIIPIGEEARKLLRNNILPEALGISVVARALYPDLDYKRIWGEPIASAMQRESQLVRNYFVDFLRGDFTKWTDVLDSLKRHK